MGFNGAAPVGLLDMEAKEIQTAQPIWKAARVENDIEIRRWTQAIHSMHGIGSP